MLDSKKFVVMGPVGSGKSTQAKLVAKQFNLPFLDSGEMLRNLDKTTKLGQQVWEIISRGHYVPDELILGLLAREIAKPAYQRGFVITGIPRTMVQAEKLPFEPDLVIYLVVSDQENSQRLLGRGRHDDTLELIRERLEIYHRETEPIIDFYRLQGKLLKVDGERPIEIIAEDIRQQLAHPQL